MTLRRLKAARAVIGGVIGSLTGFTVVLLLSGFRIEDALIALLWGLPFFIGLTIFYMRDRRDSK